MLSFLLSASSAIKKKYEFITFSSFLHAQLCKVSERGQGKAYAGLENLRKSLRKAVTAPPPLHADYTIPLQGLNLVRALQGGSQMST